MRLSRTLSITLAVLLFSVPITTADGQTPRRTRQTKKRAPAVKYEPLTEDQKRSIAGILEAARALEITYQYDPSRYYDESSALAARADDFTPTLPDGQVKNAIFVMSHAHGDAGYLYSTIFPHRETEWEQIHRQSIEALERFERAQGSRPANAESYSDREARERNSRIARLLSFYGIEGLTPYQARAYVFAIAQGTRRLLEAALPKIPIAPSIPQQMQPSVPQQTEPSIPQQTEPSIISSRRTKVWMQSALPVAPQPKVSVSYIVGSWMLEWTMNNVNSKVPLTVQMQDGKYTVVLGVATEQITLSDITVSENRFSFTAPQIFRQGKAFSLTISGKVENDRITGQFSMTGVSSDVKGISYGVPLTGARSQ